MLVEELIKLAQNIQMQQAEAQIVEVKAAHQGCPTKLYDTLSSFSNQDSGGILVFGLDERKHFEAVGVYDLQDLQKKVTEQCNQMEPLVRAVFTFAEYQGNYLCSAEIPAVDIAERPCYYKGTGKVRGSYVRVGDADMPMTDYEVYSYEAYRKHLHEDERPVDRCSLSLLDIDKVNQYIQDKKRERPQFSLMEERQIYEMLNVTRNDIPTLAAVMNFGLYPQGIFPQYCITAVVVPGYEIGDMGEKAERFLDNKRISGTIAEMVEEAITFCKRNMKVRTIIDEETGRRKDKTEYPVNAVREAVLNALIHRDYSIHTEGTPVQLDFFADRLEIHSPGTLYGRMTVEQLGVARPDLRNPALAVMTESLTGAENRYSGIPTIRREMKEYGLPEPVFENRRNEFVVILYNEGKMEPEKTEELDLPARDMESILRFCEKPRLRSELVEFLGVKTTFYVMSKYINPLLKRGYLAMTMPEKPKSKLQRYYTVKK
ncbi:MAG: putative DNA binding domain-containing protein [Hungatella hathewayi]|nr:putative DNA binding domain-containing protein [Hungatella hathewayi]